MTPKMFRIYAGNFAAKEASRNFIYSVKIIHSNINIIQRKLIYLKRSVYSHQEWSPASSKTSTFLDQKPKEQETVRFSKVPYFNVHTIKMVYSAILKFVSPMVFHKKWILTAFNGSNCYLPPSTIKYDTYILNPDLPKDHYMQIGFTEFSIGQAPEQIVSYDDLKCIRRQYGLHHYFTGIINGEIGDTYNRMAVLMSDTETYFHYGIAVS